MTTLAAPILVLNLQDRDVLEFDPRNGNETYGYIVGGVEYAFLFVQLSVFGWYVYRRRRAVFRWIVSLRVEGRFVSRPALVAARVSIVVFALVPAQIVLSVLYVLHIDRRIDMSNSYLTVYLYLTFVVALSTATLVWCGIVGATKRNLVGSRLRTANEAVPPLLQSYTVLAILTSEVFKASAVLVFLIAYQSGYRDIDAVDNENYWLASVTLLLSFVELIALPLLASRVYLIFKFKKRLGYHPAPFEEIVHTAVPYERRKGMQEGSDRDTDSELSGLDDDSEEDDGGEYAVGSSGVYAL